MHFSVDTKTATRIRMGGSYLRSGLVSLRFLPDEAYRYSPVVSKKQGTSVRRNRIKRVLRDIMRAGVGTYPTGSYLVYYNGTSAPVSRSELAQAVDQAMALIRDRQRS